MKQNLKWKIPHTVFERRILCFSSYKNRKSKVKLWWVGASERKKRAFFVGFNLFTVSRFLCFMSMYSVLNTLSEYTTFLHFFNCFENCWKLSLYRKEQIYFYIVSKNIISYWLSTNLNQSKQYIFKYTLYIP